jgi:hypothetical protein
MYSDLKRRTVLRDAGNVGSASNIRKLQVR